MKSGLTFLYVSASQYIFSNLNSNCYNLLDLDNLLYDAHVHRRHTPVQLSYLERTLALSSEILKLYHEINSSTPAIKTDTCSAVVFREYPFEKDTKRAMY